jgi:hypothetical protein
MLDASMKSAGLVARKVAPKLSHQRIVVLQLDDVKYVYFKPAIQWFVITFEVLAP